MNQNNGEQMKKNEIIRNSIAVDRYLRSLSRSLWISEQCIYIFILDPIKNIKTSNEQTAVLFKKFIFLVTIRFMRKPSTVAHSWSCIVQYLCVMPLVSTLTHKFKAGHPVHRFCIVLDSLSYAHCPEKSRTRKEIHKNYLLIWVSKKHETKKW